MPRGVPIRRAQQAATAEIKTETSEQALRSEVERLKMQIEEMKIPAVAQKPGPHVMVRDPDVPERIAAGEFHDISKAPPVEGASRFMAPSDFDRTAVSERLAKKMGIDLSAEEACWRRRDNWQNLGFNDVEEFLDHNEGARVPTDASGNMHFRDDNVLCCRSRKYGSELAAERMGESAKHDAEFYPNQEKMPSEAEMIDMREQNRYGLQKLFEGSATKGMPLEKAGLLYTAEETARTRDR